MFNLKVKSKKELFDQWMQQIRKATNPLILLDRCQAIMTR
jgi:hypothetical protein